MNIVIIEQNKIFRESLKTVLNQIQDFKVIFDSDTISYTEDISNIHVNIILIDYNLGKSKCNETINKAKAVWGISVKFLFMTDFNEECTINGIKTSDIILKNSSKKQFENKIRKQEINNLHIS